MAATVGVFSRLLSARGSLLRPLQPNFTPCSVLSQRRSRHMPPAYKEENIAEKEMKRIEGVSMCPTDCLCSRDLEITYKNTRLLSQFTSQQTGCILPRTITKVCMRKQRRIAKEIKKARTMGFLPYTESLVQYHRDPKLFNCSRARTEMYSRIRRDRDFTRTQKFQSYSLGNE